MSLDITADKNARLNGMSLVITLKVSRFYLHMSGTINVPGYKHRWNRDLQLHFWNYIRRNKHNIHPLDLAK